MADNIDIFDRYVKGEMSSAEIASLKSRLRNDKDFAQELREYALIVRGVCQEAEQNDIDFGHALKSISKDELRQIIGEPRKEKKPTFFRERMMWIASMAAMMVIAVTIGWSLYSSSQAQLCDMAFYYNYTHIDGSRGVEGEEYTNLSVLSKDEVKKLIPVLQSSFEAAEVGTQDWQIEGWNLAMAYLKVHDKKNAVKTFKALNEHSDDALIEELLNQLK